MNIYIKKRMIIILACLVIALPFTVLAQNKHVLETNAKVILWVDWDCFSLHYPKTKLKRVVHEALKKVGDGAKIWGDRSFAYDLDGDRKPEYFIPLVCGAVGNCSWGIFALNPSRLLGIVNGENIYVRQRIKHWSALTVYTHNSCCDGFLDTYIFRKGKYVKLSGEYYVTGYYGLPGFKANGSHPYPKFMETTPSTCASKKINPAA
ncbi:MAG: hypothetical protein QOC96_319 [Acidobacteriota bacterium]|jgi:hypothetical protein|nr:hypothetical protein [Acidobacteriota bacterium]